MQRKSDKNSAEARVGVYFSASDAVYPWVMAFLRSFREFNPALPLHWIPFNDDSSRIAGLSEKYDFQTYEDNSFVELEELGQRYELGHSPHGRYWFRRYAAFWGPLDYFIYLDGRFIVLSDLKRILNALTEDGLDFLHYDMALDQVYSSASLRKEFLYERGGRGFLSGVWAGKKGVFEKEEMLRLGYQSLSFRDQLNPRNTDQAFINYCIDSKPQLKIAHVAEWLGGALHTSWARQSGRVYRKNKAYYLWDYGGLDHKKQVLLMHWAGYKWTDPLPQGHVLNKYSPPSFRVKLKRLSNSFKYFIKSNFFLRKLLGHV